MAVAVLFLKPREGRGEPVGTWGEVLQIFNAFLVTSTGGSAKFFAFLVTFVGGSASFYAFLVTSAGGSANFFRVSCDIHGEGVQALAVQGAGGDAGGRGKRRQEPDGARPPGFR